MSYNKFAKSTSSKLGIEIARSGGLTQIMQEGVVSAIPIWDMLHITEEQYMLDYEYKAFVENEEAITALVKEAFDNSLNIIEEDEK